MSAARRWARVDGRFTGGGTAVADFASLAVSFTRERACSLSGAVSGGVLRTLRRQIDWILPSIATSHSLPLRFDRSGFELYHPRDVIQRNSLLIGCLLALAIGCEKTPTAATTQGTQKNDAAPARIVSLSPAATDLLLAMGAEREIVGVSTFDSDPRVANLPRLGDYENVDWERIQSLAPSVMIVQIAPDRMPAGFVDRARAFNIALHSAKIDRFTDIIVESDQIGAKVGRADEARKMWQALRDQIDEVQARVSDNKPVRTLIITSAEGLGVAGPETYLDDILGFAGGVNALDQSRAGYSRVDCELLLSLAPDAVIQLLPGATNEQIDAADRLWASMPDCPAVRNGRIYTFTQEWVLAPNAHVGELTELIASKLHPGAK